MKTLFLKMFFLLVCLTTFLNAFDYKVEKVVSNLGVIWGMDFLDENQLLINQKDGKVFLFNLQNKKLEELSNPPKVYNFRQGGLLDIKLSPNYKVDKWIYFTYSKEVNGYGVTTLARAKLENKSFTSWQELLISKSSTSSGVHYGSRITFDEQGHLFFSIGDRGDRQSAQNLQNHAGTIIRLSLDGTVPKNNPFVNDKSALNEIYSYGHRNPQGIFYDKKTKRLWAIEHGPRGGDEINLIEKANNYGWPTISYGKEYWTPLAVGEGTHKEGMIQPKKYYDPSIAPSSLIVYSGKLFKELEGKLLAGALKLTHINITTLDEEANIIDEKRIMGNLKERIRNIIESKDGLIYFSTDSGKIFVIKPK